MVASSNGGGEFTHRSSSIARRGTQTMSSENGGPGGGGGGGATGGIGGGPGRGGIGAGENIRVCLRLRPMNKLEASRRSKDCVDIHKGGTKVTVDAPLEGEYDFSFDRVFDERAPQSAVFRDAALPMSGKLLDGYDCALIAYGQTGSGKTYTMMGSGGGLGMRKSDGADGGGEEGGSGNGAKDSSAQDPAGKKPLSAPTDKAAAGSKVELDEDAGMIPRIIKDVFRLMAEASPSIEYTVRCSYVEIYMEKVLDLLNPTNRSLSVVDDCSEDKDDSAGGGGGGGGGAGATPREGGVRIKGASEPCCFDEADVMALVTRGNAYRKLSSNKMNTDSNRSHAVFIIRLEQKDCEAGTTKTSQMQLVDLAGSEMAGRMGKNSKAKRGSVQGRVASQKEAKMVNRSFTTLASVVKALSERQGGGGRDGSSALDNRGGLEPTVPYKKSKLTRVLRDAFGGKCSTGIILTASSSSYSISETISTIRFGQRCRRVKNAPQVKLDLSGAEYRRQLAASEKKQAELMNFVKALAGECRQLKNDGLKGKIDEASHKGPLWDSIDTILEDSDMADGSISKAASLLKSPSRRPTHGKRSSLAHIGIGGDEVQAELDKAQAQLADMKKEMAKIEESRNRAESILGEIQSEAAVLRTQNDNLSAEKKKNMQDLIDAKNEIQILSQRKLEVEHNLRTSQFRENEATVFLRQFRRFYRRLLRNKAAQGTGDTNEITAKVPGVPDLNDLIDVDTLLLESGLIEEEELRDDATVGTYRPSSQALLRSTSAAKKASKEAAALGKAAGGDGMGGGAMLTASSIGRTVNVGDAKNLEMISELGDGGVSEMGGDDRAGGNMQRMPAIASVTGGELGAGADAGAGESEGGIESLAGSVVSQSITHRGSGPLSAMNIAQKQQALMTPSGRLTSMREKDLERDLLQMTERCIELQIALNEEKANVDVLTNRTGSLSKKRLAQEAISLRQALDRKTHDLQAIIWKMNELHLINKTYNEKMANREQHVTYLEENLVDLQNTNRRLITDRHESEKKLRDELNELKVLVDSMTIPLWQFDEGSKTERRSLASRVVVPVHGGAHPDGVDWSNSPPAYVLDADETSGSDSDASGSEDEGEPSKKDLAPKAKKSFLPGPAEKREKKKDQSTELGTSATASVDTASTMNDHTRDRDAALNGTSSMKSEKAAVNSKKPASDERLVGRSSPALASVKDESSKSSAASAKGPLSAAAATAHAATPKDIESKNEKSIQDHHGKSGDEQVQSFTGGKAANDLPRRFVQKASTSIKPGVLKESKKKGGGDSSIVSGSGSTARSRATRASGTRASTSRAQGQRAQVR